MLPIIDAHCHIYPDKIAYKAAQSIGDFYNIAMNLDGRISTLLAEGRTAGISHFLVHSVATSPAQVRSINTYISECVQSFPRQMSGFGTLHPDSPHIAQDVEDLIRLGLKGVKLHPDVQQFYLDSPPALAVFEQLEGRLPVLVHTGDFRYAFSHPSRLKRVMAQFPRLTVIAAHFGLWSDWEQGAAILADTPGLFVDCSSSLYALSAEKAVAIIRQYGVERVLFGTDYPMWSPSEELARFMALDLPQADQRRILYDNAAGLLGLPPR